jgi:hypothetical protein
MTMITPKAFRLRELAHAGEGLQGSALNYAANLYTKKKERFCERDVDGCIELARELERFYQHRLREDGPERHPELFPEPHTASGPPVGELMASDVVVERLTPHIQQIRQDLFGRPTVPFPTYEAAVEWLVCLGNEQWKRWQDQNEQKQREFRQKSGRGGLVLFWEPHESALWQAREKAGPVFHISYERRRIPYTTVREDLIPDSQKPSYHLFRQHHPDIYPSVEAWIWSIAIHEDSVLAKLEDAAHKIADAAGFSKRDVIAWILADEKPTIPPLRMRNEYKELKLPDDRTLRNRYVVIEILEPEHLTYYHLEQIYHSIREDFNVSRVKALTVAHQRLRDIVNRLGGVPVKHGTKTSFWEQVRQEWNREVGREEYSEWRPLQMKYKRLREKLKLGDQQDRHGE